MHESNWSWIWYSTELCIWWPTLNKVCSNPGRLHFFFLFPLLQTQLRPFEFQSLCIQLLENDLTCIGCCWRKVVGVEERRRGRRQRRSLSGQCCKWLCWIMISAKTIIQCSGANYFIESSQPVYEVRARSGQIMGHHLPISFLIKTICLS